MKEQIEYDSYRSYWIIGNEKLKRINNIGNIGDLVSDMIGIVTMAVWLFLLCILDCIITI